jgi:hypothetical protein
VSDFIRIPKRFFDDHAERDLDTPAIVRETKAHYIIRANDPFIDELRDDAEFYAAEHGPDMLPPGLKASARATLAALAA